MQTQQSTNHPIRHTSVPHPQRMHSASTSRLNPDVLAESPLPPTTTPLLGKKTDVLHYYRQQNLHFLNLGSVLIGMSDHLLYHFDAQGNVDGITQLAA